VVDLDFVAPPTRRLRLGAAILLLAIAPRTASAQGIAARFVDTWATRGEPVTVAAEIDDPLGIVDRVAFDLAVDGVWVETSTVRGAPWAATFSADRVWPFEPARLAVRARLLGKRGGTLLELGVPFPKPLEILTPAASARRRKDMTRIREPESFPVVVGLAAEGRAGSASRTRFHLAILGPVARRTELKLGLSVGPSFAEPDALSGGGPLVLGSELGVRVSAPTTFFVDAVATADVRFPGFDPGGAIYLGARGPWGQVGWELSAGGGSLVADVTGDADAVFFGLVRLGVRFGSTDSEVDAMKEP